MSRSGVDISRRKVPSCEFELLDLFSPAASAERFSGWATHAVCSEVLEHVDDPARFLLAARAYLAKRTTLIVTLPGGPMSAFDRHIGHRRHFDRQSLTDLLQVSGFSVERTFRCGFPFFNLYRLLVIARGERLATDFDNGSGVSLANIVMAVFRGLFRLNLPDAPGGWQLVAISRSG